MDLNKISPDEIRNHIVKLGKLFRRSGFDGYFHTNSGFADKIEESLSRWIASYLEGNEYKQEFPVLLSTYTDWRGSDQERTICHFKVDYKVGDGFKVTAIEVNRLGKYSETLSTKALQIKNSKELPTLRNANDLVSEKVMGHKLKNKRRIRF